MWLTKEGRGYRCGELSTKACAATKAMALPWAVNSCGASLGWALGCLNTRRSMLLLKTGE
jgi:hypothetical protein